MLTYPIFAFDENRELSLNLQKNPAWIRPIKSCSISHLQRLRVNQRGFSFPLWFRVEINGLTYASKLSQGSRRRCCGMSKILTNFSKRGETKCNTLRKEQC